MTNLDQHISVAGVGLALGTLVGLLPPIAAGLAVLWYLIQIFEWIEGRIKRRQQEHHHAHPPHTDL